MIKNKVRNLSVELEKLISYNFSIERSLDLLEASTSDLEELIAINTMRESLLELQPAPEKGVHISHELLAQYVKTTGLSA